MGDELPRPAYIVADSDLGACERMLEMCPTEHFYIRVRTGEEALQYYGGFAVVGALIAEDLPCVSTTLPEVVAKILERGGRVVILAEEPDAGKVAVWKERGALDCIAHPTKSFRRMERVRDALQEMEMAHWRGRPGEHGT